MDRQQAIADSENRWLLVDTCQTLEEWCLRRGSKRTQNAEREKSMLSVAGLRAPKRNGGERREGTATRFKSVAPALRSAPID